jgi:hypothetical protein
VVLLDALWPEILHENGAVNLQLSLDVRGDPCVASNNRERKSQRDNEWGDRNRNRDGVGWWHDLLRCYLMQGITK